MVMPVSSMQASVPVTLEAVRRYCREIVYRHRYCTYKLAADRVAMHASSGGDVISMLMSILWTYAVHASY